jgi:hypothetical protein
MTKTPKGTQVAKARIAPRTSKRHRLLPALALAILAALVLAAPASATKVHLPQGSFGSAAQPAFGNVTGVTVDHSSGDVLVIDAGAKTVTRFNPDGTPANFSGLGTNVIDAKGGADKTPQDGFDFGPGFGGEAQVAVDNSGTATDGDIYVTQAKANLVDIFAASGEYLGQLTKAGTSPFSGFSPCGVAVASNGDVFLAGAGEGKIHKFAPTANPPTDSDYVTSFTGLTTPCNLAAGAGSTAGSLFVNTFVTLKGNSVLQLDGTSGAVKSVVEPEESRAVAVDPVSGHVYVLHVELEFGSAKSKTVREYAGPTLISVTPYEGSANPGSNAIAVDGSGNLYEAYTTTVQSFGPLVTVPDTTTGAATISGDNSATLNGTVNPESVALEECYFEYGTSTSYGQSAPCVPSAATIGASPTPVAVKADIAGLASETPYHFRLVAKNPNATIPGPDREFKTPSKPNIAAQWTLGVGAREATLKAAINPENAATTYRFEYGTQGPCDANPCTVPPTAEPSAGADATEHTVGVLLGGLTPAATYHYRVVATNSIGVSEGADRTFTTFPLLSGPPSPDSCPNSAFRNGLSALLADCRAYEMVSPVDKQGGNIEVLNCICNNRPSRLDQASAAGTRLTYSSYRAFANPNSAPYTSQYFAVRHPGEGWSSASLSPATEGVDELENILIPEFSVFTEDLCSGWILKTTEPLLAPGAVAGWPNLYRHDNCGAADFEALSKVTPVSGENGVNKGGTGSPFIPSIEGHSADGAHTFFSARGHLTEDAGPAKLPQLYVAYEGGLANVCYLPSGAHYAKACGLGRSANTPYRFDQGIAGAVSADGSRAIWSDEEGKLYMRINPEREQSAVKGGKCTEAEAACTLQISQGAAAFKGAAADGSRVIYAETKGIESALFYADILEEEGQLVAHTNPEAPIAKGGPEEGGVLGMSADAKRLYFASRGVLTAGANPQGMAPTLGKPNLYLFDAEKSGAERFAFLGTLAGDGLPGAHEFPFSPVSKSPYFRSSRVSPDGLHAVFTSQASLTGYDNTDRQSGEADAEVFFYDAAANGGAGLLRCVSCNLSGARPAGKNLFGSDSGETYWFAARIPGWSSDLYPARPLSDDGKRVFFESADALLPRDTNGTVDVYEWEQGEGQAQCEALGAELFLQREGGCLALISSGESPEDSAFVDASTDGKDVFFTTGASLLPQDPGLIDIYDARQEGGFAPQPGQPAGCEGEACQGPLSPPNDPTPASATFQGAGNAREVPSSCRKGKGKGAAKKRCLAKKHKHPKRAHAKRANRDRRATR